jgi:hypothetical protein
MKKGTCDSDTTLTLEDGWRENLPLFQSGVSEIRKNDRAVANPAG